MEIRRATTDDVESIRHVVRTSLEASYEGVLDESTIDEFVSRSYEETLTDRLESDDTVYLVVETDTGIVGFSQSDLIDETPSTGRIDWIHVDPAARSEGIGSRLFDRTHEELRSAGADKIEAQVLAEHETGIEFYEARGFERAGAVDVEIGSETKEECILVETDRLSEQPQSTTETIDVDGETLYVNFDGGVKGSKSRFYTAHLDESMTNRYGWFCGHCESLDNAMDAMGRIECNVCGNRRKATRWDASYL